MIDATILTVGEMRAAERELMGRGVDAYDLMERAGAAATEIIWRAAYRREVLVLCGPGNNGGDGFVIARRLQERGAPVRVAAPAASVSPSARKARTLWKGPVEDLLNASPAPVIVDALFGTGLSRGLTPEVSGALCHLAGAAITSIAIDIPSGVDSDTGALLSEVPRVDICIALGAWKPAHYLYPVAAKMGRRVLAPIGVDTLSKLTVMSPPEIAAPTSDAHKYSRGLVQVIGGEMPGAAALAATAAAHSGAGMVRLSGGACSATVHAIVRTDAPDLDDHRIRAVVIGPGLGRGKGAESQMMDATAAGHPMVIDADALSQIRLSDKRLPLGSVLTPHEGEFERLFGQSGFTGSKVEQARAAAQMAGAVVLYKGADSVVASPDGRAAIGQGASPWLSTAGTGDVLAGIIGARLAVCGDPFRAACEGVWLHSDAARRAGAAFMADDLLAALPAAIAARL